MSGNENKAHIGKGGIENFMTPCDGSGSAGPVSPGEMGPGILGAPVNSDPHRHGRNSNNLSQKPPERPGSHYTDEIHRRLHGRDVKYR
jgi:hypothetical protein